MTATAVRTRFLALLDQVAAGNGVEEVTKDGRTAAHLVPAHGPRSLRCRLAGVALTAAPEAELFATGPAWELP